MDNCVISLLFYTDDDLAKTVAAELKNSARFRVAGAARPVSMGADLGTALPDTIKTVKAPDHQKITGIIICEQEMLAELAEALGAKTGTGARPEAEKDAGCEAGNIFYLTMPRELFRDGNRTPLTGQVSAKLDAAGIRWCMADSRRPESVLEMLWHISSLDVAVSLGPHACGAGGLHTASALYSVNPVETYLKRSGFSPLLSGYAYLAESAELAAGENEYQGVITKYIYPEIAVRHGKSAESVERAIRFAIESAWQSGRLEGFRPWENSGTLLKPTNAEMIFRLARIAEGAGSGAQTA